MRKQIFFSLLLVLVTGLFVQCTCDNKVRTRNGVILTEVPVRPAGQEDAILMTAPKLDTVRVGIIGLGMRGPVLYGDLYTLKVLK